MATITQVASASSGGASSLTLTGINFQPKDAFVLVSASYGTPSSVATFSNSETVGQLMARTIQETSPDFRSTFYVNLEMSGTVTGGTLTWTQSTSAECAVILFRIRPDTNKVLVFRDANSGAYVGTSPSITLAGGSAIVPGSIIVGAGAVADDTYFIDSDTTNGSWSSSFFKLNTSGDDLGVFGQTKITSGASGSQTFNGTWLNSSSEYSILFMMHLYELELPYWGSVNYT